MCRSPYVLPFLRHSTSNNGVTSNYGLGVIQGHWKWHFQWPKWHSVFEWVLFPIRIHSSYGRTFSRFDAWHKRCHVCVMQTATARRHRPRFAQQKRSIMYKVDCGWMSDVSSYFYCGISDKGAWARWARPVSDSCFLFILVFNAPVQISGIHPVWISQASYLCARNCTVFIKTPTFVFLHNS